MFEILNAVGKLQNLVGPSAESVWLIVHSSTPTNIVTVSDDESLLTLGQPEQLTFQSVEKCVNGAHYLPPYPPNAAISDGSEKPILWSRPCRILNA